MFDETPFEYLLKSYMEKILNKLIKTKLIHYGE